MNNGVPADYIRTQAIIDNIVQNVHPNLIVITGDTVDPAKSKNFKSLYT
jgi:metallophosphoesterase superfamily enzyme